MNNWLILMNVIHVKTPNLVKAPKMVETSNLHVSTASRALGILCNDVNSGESCIYLNLNFCPGRYTLN
jgi:hypothetical protein